MMNREARGANAASTPVMWFGMASSGQKKKFSNHLPKKCRESTSLGFWDGMLHVSSTLALLPCNGRWSIFHIKVFGISVVIRHESGQGSETGSGDQTTILSWRPQGRNPEQNPVPFLLVFFKFLHYSSSSEPGRRDFHGGPKKTKPKPKHHARTEIFGFPTWRIIM